jgi:hypothetical protein
MNRAAETPRTEDIGLSDGIPESSGLARLTTVVDNEVTMRDQKQPHAGDHTGFQKMLASKLGKKRVSCGKRPPNKKTHCAPVTSIVGPRNSAQPTPKTSSTMKTPVGTTVLTWLDAGTALVSRLWRWVRSIRCIRTTNKRVHVAATASLGDKRFVAVIQVDDLQFLIGGGPTKVVLLAKLDTRDPNSSHLDGEMSSYYRKPVSGSSELRA